ncbi:MAG: bifunctional (p)ppGpp synthetase/guanosine-3',5'-bis(diphosphate) 3'-pyrophosphohydrolase [Bacteroidetes bacterium]|nr:bifunctional (p)ppGpp synthetase/guanosine-3',5'-bis(diphosphate) 3'-pyrophosphohydrolase [Bacteroidota bacterium]
MNKIERLVDFVSKRFGDKQQKQVEKAVELARSLIGNTKRYDGGDFTEHAVGVALIVAEEIGLRLDSILASLLHDVSRMGLLKYDDVEIEFGVTVREVLKGMNSISKVETNTDSKQTEFFKELIVSLSSNPRVILIKLADRLEVMRSLEIFPPEKRVKKSWETLHIYSQIAHKLGLYNLKSELEDLSLRNLEPDDYKEIERKIIETEEERDNFIVKFIEPIKNNLDKKGIKCSAKGRTKSIYSIWRKMQKQKVAFEDVYDVFAVRFVLDAPIDEEKSLCWYTYSVVTDFNNPNPNRLRDWVSIPKSNGYESLHTTVVTKEGRWVEVQIRTQRMDEMAECGIAAHWRYKGVKEEANEDSKEWLEKLRNVIDSVDVKDGGIKFTGDIEQTNREIFVFTPNGDLKKLPKGSTILDFAYDIHTNLGNTCVGGRINHKNATIREEIKSGDLVEILTSKNQIPRRDWLNIVQTSKARSRIKAFLRDQETKDSMIGREELERKLKNWKLNIDLEESTNYLCKIYKIKSVADVYNMIAINELDILDIKNELVKYLDIKSGKVEDVSRNEEKQVKKTKKPSDDTLIIGDDLDGMQYKMAKCCNPIFGDKVFGFVTVLSGITIHRYDCPNGKRLLEQYPYRIIEAHWQGEATETSIARIGITSEDIMGLEYNIKEILKTLSVELRGISTDYSKGGVESVVTIAVNNRSAIDSVVYLLKQISGIKKVLVYK